MRTITVTLIIDEDAIKDASGQDNLNDAIDSELGWLANSGITVSNWSFDDSKS